MENDLGGGWWQHTRDQNARQEAFVIVHGGYNPLEGMTEHLSPAALAFYVFHGDMIYAGEMIRILHPVAVVKYGNDNQFFTCHKKIRLQYPDLGRKPGNTKWKAGPL
jgi:hypothetical protein